MCGCFNISTSIKDVASALQAVLPAHVEDQASLPNYNAAPGQLLPVVAGNNPREVSLMRWGLLPPWTNESRMGTRMINARSEMLTEKPSYRMAFRHRRCLIPADGFHEWTGPKDRRQPMSIRQSDGELLALAGLWELHARFGLTFTIRTTSSNAGMSAIHNRMPVILDPDFWDDWLDSDNVDVAEVKDLLIPLPDYRLTGYPVSPDVNDVRNNSPDLVEAI